EGISFSDLKGTLETFYRALLGAEREVKLTPSFFPFVEPGAPVEVSCFVCEGRRCRTCAFTGWIDTMRAAMVPPPALAAAESVEWPWEGLNGVVVARVLEVSDHPESAKLCLARIDVGGAERAVVVGVRNMKAGDLVPYAGPGARVPTLSEPLSVRTLRGQL